MIQNLEQHYKALGLEPGASLEEVNQAYKDLVFIWHPDRVPQENERLIQKSVAKLQQINEARDSLRSYHRKYKPASGKKPSQPSSSSSSSAYGERRTYSQSRTTDKQSSRDKSPSSSSNYREKNYSEPRSPYRRYTRPHEQASQWNYRDYYSSSGSSRQSTGTDGYQNFRESERSYGSSRTRNNNYQRPYNKSLRGADLSRANFKEKDFSGQDLSQANLSYADLSDTFLHKVILEEANLQGANLKGANLLQANLRNADLREANLIGADLSGSDLSGADLTGAKVGFHNKIMVKITAVKLTGATLPDGSIHP